MNETSTESDAIRRLKQSDIHRLETLVQKYQVQTVRADVCRCFSTRKTSLAPHEALWKYGKDISVSQ